MSATTKDIFESSLARCLESPTFVTDFYDSFLAMSPDVRAKFERTDFSLHIPRLVQSLKTMASAVAGEPKGLRELAERAETHSRRHLNIKPDLYEIWSAAMVAAAREHDPEWDTTVEEAWNRSLEILVAFMIRRY